MYKQLPLCHYHLCCALLKYPMQSCYGIASYLCYDMHSYSVKLFGNSESTLGSRDLQLMFVRHIPSLLLSASDNKLERYFNLYPIVNFYTYSSCTCRCYGGDSFKDPISSTCSLKFPSLNCMLEYMLHFIVPYMVGNFHEVLNFIIR
jgi:hypothetical protein